MKFCPYCGADLLKEDAAFCAECGKQLSASSGSIPTNDQAMKKDSPSNSKSSKPVKKKAKEKKHKKKGSRKTGQDVPVPEITGESVDDGYDGYYNDVLPPDLDRAKEGLDKGLIKNIVALCVAVVFIIGLCVAMMYLL